MGPKTIKRQEAVVTAIENAALADLAVIVQEVGVRPAQIDGEFMAALDRAIQAADRRLEAAKGCATC